MEIEDIPTYIECYIRKVMTKFPKNEWINDNTLKIKKRDNTDLGKLTMTGNKIVIEGELLETFIKTLKKAFDEAKTKKPNSENMRDTVFSESMGEGDYFNGGEESFKFMQLLDKGLKKVGIKKAKFGQSLNFGSTIHTIPTIFFDSVISDENSTNEEDGHFTRLKNFLFEKFKTDYETKESVTAVKTTPLIGLLPKEAPTDLKIDSMKVGKYYKERNFIHFYFNPFSLKSILPIEDSVTEVFKEVFKCLRIAKIEVKDTSKIKGKIFIASFLKNSNKRLKVIEQGKRDTERSISEYEGHFRGLMDKLQGFHSEQIYIQKNLELNGKGMLEELQGVKKLPFVKKMDMGTDFIELIFKATSIKVNDFNRGGYKKYGKMNFYIGEIKFKITPSKFHVFNNSGILAYRDGNPHPHGSTSNTPCFGDGGGRNKIYEMLASNKFSELATLLWFWIKTYIDSGAHVHYGRFYDSLLSQGVPIWDKNGDRIEINDANRLKSGEQTNIVKDSTYAENIKRFKNVKLEG